jgi:hypothetical protein
MVLMKKSLIGDTLMQFGSFRRAAILGLLLLTSAVSATASPMRVPSSLSGKTIVFYTHASPLSPNVGEDSYRTYFAHTSFVVRDHHQHYGRYVYRILDHQNGIAQVIFKNQHRPKNNRRYQCVLLFHPNGREGYYLYQDLGDPRRSNAGSFVIQ